ncbi:hypothetical protein BH24ACI4_BH24ACI4_16630 [soil metagenome]
MALVRERLISMGARHVVLSQRRFEESPFLFEIRNGELHGSVRVEGESYALADFGGVYTRMMDDRALPEIAGEPEGSPRRSLARRWQEAVSTWCEITPARVVNRAAAMASNASKPYQAQVILRHGLKIPETLITSDPALVQEFTAEHRRVVFKSISGIRSIVRELVEEDSDRLNLVRWCPVQFQRFVEGRNVRVHTVGDEVFATGITTDVVDYRYAARQGGDAVLEPVELSDHLAGQCLALARDLNLPLAGIDLKITPDDDVYCFEVNPSPAYSYYESHTGQPISAAIARYLAG